MEHTSNSIQDLKIEDGKAIFGTFIGFLKTFQGSMSFGFTMNFGTSTFGCWQKRGPLLSWSFISASAGIVAFAGGVFRTPGFVTLQRC